MQKFILHLSYMQFNLVHLSDVLFNAIVNEDIKHLMSFRMILLHDTYIFYDLHHSIESF